MSASAYDTEQLCEYSDLIGLPNRYHFKSRPEPNAQLLNALQVLQLATIPYENLLLHYCDGDVRQPPVLEPQALFNKIVRKRRGRGGYCLENTIFFKNILRGFGFRVHTVAATIRPRIQGVPGGDYMGIVHTVNIVTFADGRRYACDVSFGGDGPTKPLPLVDGLEHHNMGTQTIRLRRDFIPCQTLRSIPANIEKMSHSEAASDSSSLDSNNGARAGEVEATANKLWIYEYRNSSDSLWNAYYAFQHANEFTDPDMWVINEFAGGSPRSFQTTTVLVVKFLCKSRPLSIDGVTEVNGVSESSRDGDTSQSTHEPEIYGKLMAFDAVVKLNEGGKTRTVRTCESEAERVEALQKWFGISLSSEEVKGIRGYKTEIKPGLGLAK